MNPVTLAVKVRNDTSIHLLSETVQDLPSSGNGSTHIGVGLPISIKAIKTIPHKNKPASHPDTDNSCTETLLPGGFWLVPS